MGSVSKSVSDDYKKQFGIDTERVKRFILSTQKDKTITTSCFANDNEYRICQKQLEELPDKIRNDEAFVNAVKNSNKSTLVGISVAASCD